MLPLVLPTSLDFLGEFSTRPFAVPAEETLFVRAERVIVRPGVELENAGILIERGVIVAGGPDLAAPEGARTIEGKVACAGFVDPWSSLGLDEGSVADVATTPSTRTSDVYDPWTLPYLRREALVGGVTAARVQAGRGASIGGVGAVVHTQDAAERELLLADACLAASVGITRGGRVLDVFDRAGEVERLIGALEKGRRYRESQAEHRHELEEWEKKIAEKKAELEKDFKKAKKDREKDEKEAEEKKKEFKEKKYKENKKPRRPRLDPDDEVMARAVDGEIPLVVEVHRANEIRLLLDETAEFDRLRLVIAGATEATWFAAELAEREVPVILWPAPQGSGRDDEYEEHDLALAGELSRAGVRVLIGSGGGTDARELRLLAALAVSHGMDPEDAFAAITTEPSNAFDVTKRIGSLERGKSADVLILDGSPLAATSRVLQVISRGKVVLE